MLTYDLEENDIPLVGENFATEVRVYMSRYLIVPVAIACCSCCCGSGAVAGLINLRVLGGG